MIKKSRLRLSSCFNLNFSLETNQDFVLFIVCSKKTILYADEGWGRDYICSAEGASLAANLSGKRTLVGRNSGECQKAKAFKTTKEESLFSVCSKRRIKRAEKFEERSSLDLRVYSNT